MTLKKILRRLCILFLILIFPVNAFAAGGLRYGALEFHPYLLVKETYNDNIYATTADEKSDWINSLTAGLKLLLPYRGHEFALDYNAVISSYADYSSEDTVDHKASAAADLKLGHQFGLKVKDFYAKSHEDRATSASGEIEKYDTNAATVSACYQLADRSKVQLDFTHTDWNFKASTFRDRQEDLIAAYLFYRFLPKTSVFLEYDFENIDYEDDSYESDNKSNSVFIGLTWDIAANTKGTVKGGYLHKDYSLAGQDSLKTFSAFVDISHAFSSNSLMKIVAMRTENESGLLGARYYTTTGGSATIIQKLTYKTAIIIQGAFTEDDYSDAIPPDTRVRNDETLLLGAGLQWQFKDWLAFALEYNYRNRDSNIDEFDLRENRYSLSVNFTL